jgi:hypothetical protein
VMTSKSCFFINYKNTTMRFIYNKDRGILYNTLLNGEWSMPNVAVSRCREYFIVVLLSGGRLGLVYQDYAGNLLMKIFNGTSWRGFTLISKSADWEICDGFKAIAVEQGTYLFFNKLNKSSNTVSLCYSELDSNLRHESSNMIEAANSSKPIQFKISLSQDNTTAYILYEQSTEYFFLGYKTLTLSTNELSQFITIDTSPSTFIDLSFLIDKNTIHVAYIKEYEEKRCLLYSQGLKDKFTYTSLSEDRDITSCSILVIESLINCSWIKDNTVFSSLMSLDGEKITAKAYSQKLNSDNILKCTYVFSRLNSTDKFNLNEFFTKNNLSYFYPSFINELLLSNNSCLLSYFQYCIESMLSRLLKDNELILRYEKKLNNGIISNEEKLKEISNSLKRAEAEGVKKDKEIERLGSLIKTKEALIAADNSKINSILSDFKKFQEYKQLLSEGVKELQDCILEKDGKIKLLENKIETLTESINKLTFGDNHKTQF